MDHAPTTPADDRALRLLERTPVDDEHKQRLFDVVHAAQGAAQADSQELQAEFGKEAVSLIVGCNQFVRLFRGGSQPGVVELLLDDPVKETLAGAGFRLQDPEGMVFRMFGWVRVDPSQGDAKALDEAVRNAYARARRSKGVAAAPGSA